MSHNYEVDIIKTDSSEFSITFIGHGTLMFQYNGRVLHVDPWSKYDYTGLPKADVILVTHEHRDHLDLKAIQMLSKKDTVIVATEKCGLKDAAIMKNYDEKNIGGFLVKAVPAYNIVHMRGENKPFHPKGEGNGYIIQFGSVNVLVSGDTENTPELKALKNIDIAFLPMNLPYTMTPEMVVDTVKAMKPNILYPYHYGATDVSKLTDLMKNIPETVVRVRNMQ